MYSTNECSCDVVYFALGSGLKKPLPTATATNAESTCHQYFFNDKT